MCHEQHNLDFDNITDVLYHYRLNTFIAHKAIILYFF